MLEKLLSRVEELKQNNTITGEPEIGINEETNKYSISDYKKDYEAAFHIEDFCSRDDIDIEELRNALDDADIAYVL